MATETHGEANIATYFGHLNAPRREQSKEHQLLDMLVITVCAVLCGANDWEAMAGVWAEQGGMV